MLKDRYIEACIKIVENGCELVALKKAVKRARDILETENISSLGRHGH